MMNAIERSARTLAAGLGLLAFCASRAPAAFDAASKSSAAVQTPETVIASWPGVPQTEARVLIAKYGEPNTFDADKLVWYDNGDWRKTVVYRKAPESFMGYRGRDILEQTVAYEVPDRKLPELKRFDDRLDYDKTSGEISARSENESLNYLALNLADEIVTDKRTAQEARDFYRKTVRLSQSGKSSPYMESLFFQAAKANTAPEIPGAAPEERGGPIETRP
ncbi:MAG: hypothetical protein KGL53_03560 [Elusimicrobia bacterium]|nr:hypothetical protein [Elusimicrobiota bacterium]